MGQKFCLYGNFKHFSTVSLCHVDATFLNSGNRFTDLDRLGTHLIPDKLSHCRTYNKYNAHMLGSVEF